jgi:plasmid stability protein
MIRRTLLLPEQLDQRLLIGSKMTGKSVSDFARELLDRALAHQEKVRVKRMYQVLNELNGLGGVGLKDASSTIDEVLHGKQGAWRGTMPANESEYEKI